MAAAFRQESWLRPKSALGFEWLSFFRLDRLVAFTGPAGALRFCPSVVETPRSGYLP